MSCKYEVLGTVTINKPAKKLSIYLSFPKTGIIFFRFCSFSFLIAVKTTFFESSSILPFLSILTLVHWSTFQEAVLTCTQVKPKLLTLIAVVLEIFIAEVLIILSVLRITQ